MGQCPSRQSPGKESRTARRGRTPQQLLALWRRAVTRIVRLLLIRRRWAAIGHSLQQESVVDLFDGLDRVRGVLTRPRRGRRGSR